MDRRTRRIAALALAAAVAMSAGACERGDSGGGTRSPTMGPETGSGPFVSIDARSDGSTAPAWSGATTPPTSGPLFEVDTSRAEYWRLLALDRFDGQTWTSGNPDGTPSGRTLPIPATLPASRYTYPADAESLSQTFRILSDLDGMQGLPMPETAEAIAGSIDDITWDRSRSQASIAGGLEEGMEYTVRSRIVVPTPEQLDRVDHQPPRAYGRWTELPSTLDPRLGEIAERWTEHATSDYRKVLAIQQHFQRGGFVYSTDVALGDGPRALFEFLTQTKAGFCQQYSTAMAVLVRELGLPARIAVGYRAGTLQEDGSYLVRAEDAHVWVEVLFAGYGWLPFEPEAGTMHPNARPGTYLNP